MFAQGLALPKTAGFFSVLGDTTQTFSSLQIDSGFLHGFWVQLGPRRSSFVRSVPGVHGPQGRVGQSAFASQDTAPDVADAEGALPADAVEGTLLDEGADERDPIAEDAELEATDDAGSPQAARPKAMTSAPV